ncbi:hypothetical protein [Psychrobacter maritimus]|uniref:hypothetical protein n=1 Tax=Psychrobacter maritimus TaxID=256325 RepID=UPI003FD4F8D8
MRSNTFNYSLLAIGVAAVLGMSTTANAVETDKTSTSVVITNKASASYNVSGQEQPVVESNEVKITVTEQTSFSLVPAVTNTGKEVAPNGFVQFTHTLTNTGNRTDNYAITTPTAPAGYDTANSTVSYKIYNELNVIKYQKVDASGSNTGGLVTIANGGTIACRRYNSYCR